MKKTLRNILAGISIGVASLLPMKSNAQINGNIEGIKSFEPEKSYVRTNLFYGLPLEIKGYTFGEFYSDGESHFIKTSLDKAVYGNFGIKEQIIAGSGFNTRFGLGASATIPTSDKTSAKIYFVPAWIDTKGKKVDNRSIFGYFVSANLPFGFKASNFGEINIGAKNGTEWGYGEFSLGRDILENLSLSYNPALKNNGIGKAVPKLENRVTLKYTFK